MTEIAVPAPMMVKLARLDHASVLGDRAIGASVICATGNWFGVPAMSPNEKWSMSNTQADSGFLTEYQVYEPHRVGLPPMLPYFTELWRRRHFAAELSRTNMRASNTRTFFGQIWLVINPLLLALVYYLLVDILASQATAKPGVVPVTGLEKLSHLVAGIFAFYLISGCISTGANSVVSSGALISNMAFPRLLMPLSAIRTAFFRFLPTMPVYLILHAIAGRPFRWPMLLTPFFLVIMLVFATGLAATFATLQVYFRDTSSFLPYFLRIWLYLSPVLWFAEEVKHGLKPFMAFNPLYTIMGGWTDLLVKGVVPPAHVWLGATAWALASLVIGSLYFMSREREFAVRL
jgi:teichoic acid transport system permease protein